MARRTRNGDDPFGVALIEHFASSYDHRIVSLEASHLGNCGVVQRRQRLGAMWNYYYRVAGGAN